GQASPSPAAASPTAPASRPVVVRTVPLDGGELEVGLHPLVRVDGPTSIGGLVVLTLDLSVARAPADGDVSVDEVLRSPVRDGDAAVASGVRLLDLRGDAAHAVAVDAAGASVRAGDPARYDTSLPPVGTDRPRRVQLLFAAPPPGVPVFALDSAVLTPAAQEALLTAAGDVRTREPGAVTVVGHTDDQGADGYDLDRSRRRAQAVADAVGPLLGPGYPLQVDGRGETEPAVAGTTQEARARNRRVELTVSTPSAGGAALGVRTAPLPPAPPATGRGAEGVVVEQQDGWSFRVRAAGARRLQGNVVVDLEVTALPAGPGAAGLPPAPLLLGTFRDPRDFEVTDGGDTVRGAVLLQGPTAVFPLFAAVGDGAAPRACACGYGVRALPEDTTVTVSAVYPELDVAEVVLQNTPVTSADVGLRLTGITVPAEAGAPLRRSGGPGSRGARLG
ncbi:OmpA family protein, partial [Kineococcus sp. R8]|uniref:OmpA family protein n=1 Tax=Kineococcus siccus TaxID=2696567 RepID=UPI001412C0B2